MALAIFTVNICACLYYRGPNSWVYEWPDRLLDDRAYLVSFVLILDVEKNLSNIQNFQNANNVILKFDS